MKAYNIKSNRGTSVPNQFIIEDSEGRVYFQSYKSIIAVRCLDGKTELDKEFWNYSRITAKYRNMFLGEDTKTTKAKIKSGEYILTNLN